MVKYVASTYTSERLDEHVNPGLFLVDGGLVDGHAPGGDAHRVRLRLLSVGGRGGEQHEAEHHGEHRRGQEQILSHSLLSFREWESYVYYTIGRLEAQVL